MGLTGMEFTDLSAEAPNGGGGAKKGWFVSTTKAFFLAVLALLVLVAVILIVYFAHPDKGKVSPDSLVNGADTTHPDDTTEASTDGDELVTDVRLPADVTPTQYDLRLRPNFYRLDEDKFTFEGDVTIHFTVGITSKELILHQLDLDIDASATVVKNYTGGEVNLADPNHVHDMDREFYKIQLEDDLVGGQTYTVTLKFTGKLTKAMRGWYFSSYVDNTDETIYLVTTHLQPTHARRIFPCFDEPHLKAVFNTILERPRQLKSWSNTIIYDSKTIDGDFVADYYTPTPMMSTYLLAFVVADFECRESKAIISDSTASVEICARPNAYDQLDFAVDIAVDIQDFFEKYHDMPYVLNRTVHMAVPDFPAGAMENWGLILYRETALLYDPKSSAASNKQRVAVVVAHELAHMWFGNLVTPAWWDDIWLNEGFASYMEYKGMDYRLPDWDVLDQFLTDDLHRVFPLDSLSSSHPIYQEVAHPSQISQLFDTVTYSKGSSVIRMMNHFLGEDIFRQGLAKYLKDRAYGIATTADLFDFLKKEANAMGLDIDVTKVMNTWIHQMGYPVVKFEYTKSKLDVSQSHFLIDPEAVAPPSDYNYRWEIPITCVSSEDTNWSNFTVEWLNQEQGTIDIDLGDSPTWYIGNVQQQFFYRVNYPASNWEQLIAQLDTDFTIISVASRAQIIDDLYNLGRAGTVDQTLALGASKYMKDENHYVPWTALNRNVGYMLQMLAGTNSSTLLREYMRKLLQQPHDAVGWNEDVENDPHLEQRMRVVVLELACSFGVENCKNNASNEYQTWKTLYESDSIADNPISQNLRSVTYCSAVAAGGFTEWGFTVSQYQVTNSGSEKSNLRRAMACSSDPVILQNTLDLAIQDAIIKSQDFSSVFGLVARNPAGRTLAWNFLREKWQTIFGWFGVNQFTLSSIVTSATENFSTQEQLDQLLAFMEQTPDKGSAELAFIQAVDRVTANIKWRNTNEDSLNSWLESNS